tara:strand:+ start:10630 stop:11607 length:978 start_codon:yes stop_codon:yes gene_type:complete
MSLTSELLGGAGIAAITQEGIGQARGLPGQLQTAANRIAGNVGTASEFRPYSVTTGAGSSNFTDSGMTQALDPQSQQLVDSLRQQSTQQAGMLGGMTPEGLMQQMSALRAPEQARQQQQLDNRLLAQGRLGVQTDAYGGTPEQFAMQKAMQEQQSADSLASLQGARQLQGMDIQNLSGMLGLSAMPQQQLTASMQPGMTGLQIAQAPAMLEGQTIANLGQQQLQGIPASINAEALLRQSQMEGLINILGLSGGGNTGGVAGKLGGGSTGVIADLLGDAGSSIWDSLFGDESSDLSTPLGVFTGQVDNFTTEQLDALANGNQIGGN